MPEETFRWVVTGAVAISTLCIFIMAAVSLGIYRTISQVRTKVESVSDRVEPLIDTVRKLTEENAPKVTVIATRAAQIADNAKDISDVARDQAHRFAEVGRDVADRTKAQVARVDSVVDQTVVKVQVVGSGVKDAVMKPMREASGVVAGIKAGVAAYAAGRRTTVDHITQDEEMFI
jgi:methyl-accepting chemotaxis protein